MDRARCLTEGAACLSRQYHCQHIEGLWLSLFAVQASSQKGLQTVLKCFSHLSVWNTSHRCQVCISSSTNGSQCVCLFLCFCKLCSPSVCVRVCIGRQDEHPFCYRCCPFISRSGSSAWILFPRLIISAVQWTRIPPECRVKPNHYSSMGVSADVVTLLFSIFITFPSEISKQAAEHIPAQTDLVRQSIF